MLRIGEFAELTGISIYMLRNYDKIGLLVPENTDSENGYRYYSERQIIEANQIQVLKSLGFGLKEIEDINKAVFGRNEDSTERLRRIIQEKIDERSNEIKRISEQMLQMKNVLKSLDKRENYTFSVTVKKIAARKVASVREKISEFSEEGKLWKKLDDECARIKVRFADVEYNFAITHNYDPEKPYIDTEVQKVVEKLHKDTEIVNFFEEGECLAAVIAFDGFYMKIGEVKEYIAKWVAENGYVIMGEAFSIYYRSPGNESNPENFITEICFPIEKRI